MRSILTFLVNLAVRLLRPSFYVLVAVNADGKHDQVEIHQTWASVTARRDELIASGFSNARISTASRGITNSEAPDRFYGPKWKKAVGWSR